MEYENFTCNFWFNCKKTNEICNKTYSNITGRMKQFNYLAYELQFLNWSGIITTETIVKYNQTVFLHH